MVYPALVALVAATSATLVTAQPSVLTFGPSAFTAPGAYPTSAYKHYFNNPTQTASQVQPVISDPVTVRSESSLRLNCPALF